jgi:hypothetical protein
MREMLNMKLTFPSQLIQCKLTVTVDKQTSKSCDWLSLSTLTKKCPEASSRCLKSNSIHDHEDWPCRYESALLET